jgi:DNA-binding transcriptional ArsR family regulator
MRLRFGVRNRSVCELEWVTERSLQAVSYHLGALRNAGLALSRREGKIVFYALSDRGRELLKAHVATGKASA